MTYGIRVNSNAHFVGDEFKDFQVTGADDAFALIEGVEGVKGAYESLGPAETTLNCQRLTTYGVGPFTFASGCR